MTRPAVMTGGRQRHHSVPASCSQLPLYTFPSLTLGGHEARADPGTVFSIGSDINQT